MLVGKKEQNTPEIYDVLFPLPSTAAYQTSEKQVSYSLWKLLIWGGQ